MAPYGEEMKINVKLVDAVMVTNQGYMEDIITCLYSSDWTGGMQMTLTMTINHQPEA